jgi:hypothetical protein
MVVRELHSISAVIMQTALGRSWLSAARVGGLWWRCVLQQAVLTAPRHSQSPRWVVLLTVCFVSTADLGCLGGVGTVSAPACWVITLWALEGWSPWFRCWVAPGKLAVAGLDITSLSYDSHCLCDLL